MNVIANLTLPAHRPIYMTIYDAILCGIEGAEEMGRTVAQPRRAAA